MDTQIRHKVLIVDDSDFNREILQDMLSEEYDLYEAENGIRALEILREKKDEISLCLLDIMMPKMNGFEVLNIMNAEGISENVPVIIISGEDGEAQIEKAYDLGAIDYVTKPFDARIVGRRVFATMMLFEKQKELSDKLKEQIEENGNRVDKVTGLPTYTSFFSECDKIIGNGRTKETKYCMVAIDIEHFKLFNDWFGRAEGDKYLKEIAACLKEVTKEDGKVAGYIGGDNFGLFIPYDYSVIDYIQDNMLAMLNEYGQSIGFGPMYGIFEVNGETYSSQIMYDNAVTAMAAIPGDYLNRIAIYDPTLLRKTGDELMLLSDVQRGMDEHEFTFFLQPKVNMLTGKVVSAEALVRWAHKSKGLVSPGIFVPVLEDNGFITSLDRYIWEEVCKWQRDWINSGHEAIPISVNVSQIDIFAGDVADYFVNMIKKYELEPRLIDIEITESAYAKEYDLINVTVNKLREAGFRVLLDDFGSAYSSLNMLSKLKVDILKLDMKFLDLDGTENKGISILDSIVGMANQMDLPIVVEGVENREQEKMLTRLGCIYAQGFFYYKPMPIGQYEKLISNENRVEYREDDVLDIYKPLQVKEFLKTNLFSDALVNEILGPFAFYEMDEDENIKVVRVNEQYFDVKEIEKNMSRELVNEVIMDVKSEDVDVLRGLFNEAYNETSNSSEGNVVYTTHNGEAKNFHVRAFFIKERNDKKMFCATIWDLAEAVV